MRSFKVTKRVPEEPWVIREDPASKKPQAISRGHGDFLKFLTGSTTPRWVSFKLSRHGTHVG